MKGSAVSYSDVKSEYEAAKRTHCRQVDAMKAAIKDAVSGVEIISIRSLGSKLLKRTASSWWVEHFGSDKHRAFGIVLNEVLMSEASDWECSEVEDTRGPYKIYTRIQ